MDGGLLLIGMVATVFAIWFISSSRRYAEKNPALALLEGAEFLEYHKMEVAAKGVLAAPNQPALELPKASGSDA